jgi:hypothetical protein
MEEKEQLLAEISGLEPKVKEFINKGQASEAVKCQQQILKTKWNWQNLKVLSHVS